MARWRRPPGPRRPFWESDRFGLRKPPNWRSALSHKPEPFRAVPFKNSDYTRQAALYYEWLAEQRRLSIEEAQRYVAIAHKPEPAPVPQEVPLFDMVA
jgi:hypothetical protein